MFPQMPPVKTTAIGQAVRTLREEKDWTLRELADRLDMTFTLLGKKERGEVNIRTGERKRIAEAFGLTLDEFDQHWRATKVHDRPAPKGIPVINYGPAGNVIDYDHSHYADGEFHDAWQYVDRLGIDDELAFALIVVGDSMEPRIHAGDYLVFSPMTVPKPRAELKDGDVVFVRFTPESQHQGVTVARWFSGSGADVRLQKDNPRYPALTVPREEIAQLAVVIQLRTARV